MKNFFKGKIATAIILLATFVLAGVAIFTAIRLYQLRQTSVAPNAPESLPKAADACNDSCGVGFTCQVTSLGGTDTVGTSPRVSATCVPTAKSTTTSFTTNNCSLSFTLATPTPTPTPTPSPSPTPVPQCNSTCTTNSDCPSNLVCSAGSCRNVACTGELSCICATPTPTPTPTASPTPTPTVTPTPTPVPACNNICTQNTDCPSNLVCYITSGATSGYCRNTSCTGESSCICATATPTATPTGTPTLIAFVPTPTPAPVLPQSGTDWPTVFGIGVGILTIIGSLLLAL